MFVLSYLGSDMQYHDLEIKSNDDGGYTFTMPSGESWVSEGVAHLLTKLIDRGIVYWK